jgi:hypothetical protein
VTDDRSFGHWGEPEDNFEQLVIRGDAMLGSERRDLLGLRGLRKKVIQRADGKRADLDAPGRARRQRAIGLREGE